MTFPSGPAALDAAWLEGVLRSEGGFRDARIRRVGHEVIGVGFGLDGTSARVTLDGDGVPATLVAKWCKPEKAAVETRFYREIGPRLPLRLARLHASATDADRALLLLSDIAPAVQGDVLLGATHEQAAAFTDAMAGFHAVFWNRTDDPAVASLRWYSESARAISRLRESLPRFLAEWTGRLPAREIAFAAELPERVELAYASLAEAPRTLVHADLHLDNVRFPPSGPPVILDWTDVARGPAAIDFARLFVESMTPEARRASSGELTLRYARGLAAHGVAGYDVEALRQHMSDFALVGFGSAVRWAAGPGGLGPDVPRVPLVVESLVRRSAAVATEWAGSPT